MTTDNKHIELSLLENAESFTSEGIRCAIRAENKPDEWKFAILHIVQAIELVLKEILRREHESFIYDNIDNPKNTVSLLKALSRICKVSEIEFSKDDVKKIKMAVKFRNNFVHKDVNYQPMQMKVTFAQMISFLQHCYTSFLDKRLDDFVGKDLWEKVIDVEKYVKELYLRMKSKHDSSCLTEICPKCCMESFVLGKEKCFVCGHIEPVYSCGGCACPILGESEDYYIYQDRHYCLDCANNFDIEDYAHKVTVNGRTYFLYGDGE